MRLKPGLPIPAGRLLRKSVLCLGGLVGFVNFIWLALKHLQPPDHQDRRPLLNARVSPGFNMHLECEFFLVGCGGLRYCYG